MSFEEKLVKVLKVPTKNGGIIRVATIEHTIKKEVPCKKINCTKCCTGSLIPILSEKELQYKKFLFQFIEAPDWLKEQVPRAQFLAVLKLNNDGCVYYNKTLEVCTIYPNIPESCAFYDCREDPRMEEIWKNGELKVEINVGEI